MVFPSRGLLATFSLWLYYFMHPQDIIWKHPIFLSDILMLIVILKDRIQFLDRDHLPEFLGWCYIGNIIILTELTISSLVVALFTIYRIIALHQPLTTNRFVFMVGENTLLLILWVTTFSLYVPAIFVITSSYKYIAVIGWKWITGQL